MNRRGETDWSLMLMIAAAIAAIYCGIIFLPVWADNFDVREAVAAAYNTSGRNDDEKLRELIRERTKETATHLAVDEFGYAVEKPGLGLTDEQILIERDTVRGQIKVEVKYQRRVKMKPLKRIVRWNFEVKREGPIPAS